MDEIVDAELGGEELEIHVLEIRFGRDRPMPADGGVVVASEQLSAPNKPVSYNGLPKEFADVALDDRQRAAVQLFISVGEMSTEDFAQRAGVRRAAGFLTQLNRDLKLATGRTWLLCTQREGSSAWWTWTGPSNA